MKKIIIIVISMLTSVTAFSFGGGGDGGASGGLGRELNQNNYDKLKETCEFLVYREIVSENHICNQALGNSKLMEELIKKGILNEVESLGSSLCDEIPK